MSEINPRTVRESLTFEAYFDRRRRQELRNSGLTVRWFLEFGKPKTGYGVVRTVKKETRPEALGEIQRRLVDPLSSELCERPSLAEIQELSEDLAAQELTNGRALSLLSKLSFILRPGDYPLYDANARAALKARSRHVPVGDYARYAREFDAEYALRREAVADACGSRAAESHAARCGLSESILQEEWFRRRVFDWQLWLEGGGEDEDEILPPA